MDGWDGGALRRGVRDGPATGIIFVMITELLNMCTVCFAPAIIIIGIVDHEEAGALIVLAPAIVVARMIVWVWDKFQIIGGKT